jgi:uncharacterized OsmC-like protein
MPSWSTPAPKSQRTAPWNCCSLPFAPAPGATSSESCARNASLFTSLEVRASGERTADFPQIYTSIRVIYRVGGNVTHKAMEDAVRLSKEKYCSVSAMLEKTAKIEFAIEYAG